MDLNKIKFQTISGEESSLEDFRGKVLLIVNTASECGFTPQYGELEELYQKFKKEGLEILAFPCNQFGGQEPGDGQKIQEFCDLKFNISFPLFSKIEVNGENTHALYEHLKSSAPGIFGTQKIKWNFTKFLVSRDGEVIRRFAPNKKPKSLESFIRELL